MKRVCAPIIVAAGLAGCALVPFGHDGIDATTTGSIAPVPKETPVAQPMPPPIVASLDPSDWEAIRAVAATSLAGAGTGAPVDWSNPDTGNGGTIAPLGVLASRGDGSDCRSIALTVSDVRGVRRYHGDACRSPSGGWQLTDMTADDKTLL